jgi:hypothetical protein
MHQLAIQTGLWMAVLVAQIVLIGSLGGKGLARRYPFFLLYLAADAIWGATLATVNFTSPSYAHAFRSYLIMISVFQLAAVVEVYERICEHFIGIGRFRLYLAAALLGLASLLSFVTFWPNLAHQWAFPQTSVLLIERFETSALCGVLIFTRIFFHRFMMIRLAMRRNVLRHWTLLSIYFAIAALATGAGLITGGGKAAIYPINITTLAMELICLLCWTRLLTREGESLAPAPYLSESEIQEIREKDKELLMTLSTLSAEISRQSKDNRAERSSNRYRR